MQNAECKIGKNRTFGCTFFVRLKLIKRLPAGMSQSGCRVCKQTSRSSRGTRVRESACTRRFDGSAVKRAKTLFTQSPPPLRGSVSLRLGHGAALTTHRVVIHYRAVTSLPLGGSLGRDHRRAFGQREKQASLCLFSDKFYGFLVPP